MTIKLSASMVLACLIGLPTSAAAQDIPTLSTLCAPVTAANPELANRLTALMQERASLKSAISHLNSRCGAVEEGSASEASCQAEQSSLSAALSTHIQNSNHFNSTVHAATYVASGNDTSVVNACNVPSGLPKSVDNAILSGYSGAPPGVSDRVRKGFQAVMTHDWKVARAWFEDALNHDPNNAGLKHLVELSDYTEKHRRLIIDGSSPQQASPRPNPVQLPTDSDIELLFPGWQPELPRASASPLMPSVQVTSMDILFPGLPALEAKQLNDYMLDQAIKMTENDPVLIRLSNRLITKQPQYLHN